MLQFIKKSWAPILVTLISMSVFALNFQKGVFITGWDTLHPEFNFPLNFNRLITGVWRYEQGLGAIAGHSHMADLPRVFILWLMSFFTSVNALRYLYLFITYLLGGLGIYYLINYVFKNIDKSSKVIAFVCSLFYLFNLITLQTYFVPFEMFPTQFAFLPWIILSSIKFLTEKNRKNLIYFSIITLFSTPQAYAAHLWYAFFGIYVIFLFVFSYLQKQKWYFIKKSVLLITLILIINSFWLLPNLYFVKTSSDIPRDSKQNRIFSQEYRLRNQDFGNIQDLAVGKGFYFNWNIYDFKSNKFVNLMADWTKYMDNVFIKLIGYLVFLCSIFGLFLSFKDKNKIIQSFIPFFIVPFILLMNNTYPFNKLFDFITNFTLFKEALRFVFNKFSILFLFSLVVYFGYFLVHLFKKASIKFIKILLIIIVSLIFIIFSFPVFKGNLISQKMRINIPNEYFEFWDYMNKKESGTILSLPIYNFPGWEYYNWGYQGSGFIWFGLKQPILNRDFDRWSVSNEQAFREFHYSIYSRNKEYLKSNLNKFNIRYILWDKNIISPTLKNRDQIVYKNEIRLILKDLEKEKFIKKLRIIGNLDIYELKNKDIYSIENINRTVWPSYKWSNFDYAYFNQGNYFTQKIVQNNNIVYPFRDILNSSDRIKKDIVDIDMENKTYSIKIPSSYIYNTLNAPDIFEREQAFFSDLFITQVAGNEYQIVLKPLLFKDINDYFEYSVMFPGNQSTVSFVLNGTAFSFEKNSLIQNSMTYLGQVFVFTNQDNYLNNNKIVFNKITDQKDKTINSLISKFTYKSLSINPKLIYLNNVHRIGIKYDRRNNLINIESKNFQTGVNVNIDSLPHNLGYILIVKSANLSGLPLRICFKNIYSNLCSVYDELSKYSMFNDDIFIVPPSDEGVGYTISFDNISYSDFKSINQLKNISIIPIPYNYLSSIYLENNKKVDTRLIKLDQSYHEGWSAYLNNKKIKEHVLVNNWANGWLFDNNAKGELKMVFWPQYLEYLGFFLLISTFIWIILKRSEN